MFSGVYTATSGMNVDLHKMDVIANNLANADTPGFKKEVIVQKSFASLLNGEINQPELTGSYVDRTNTDFSEGASVFTGRTLDIFVNGMNFITVQTPQGEGYTKNGSLMVTTDGYLTTSSGDLVLGSGGPISIGEANNITISQDGYIYTDGDAVDQLKIVSLEDINNLSRLKGSVFVPQSKIIPQISEDFIVKQNFLESSNVSGSGTIKEMVNMIKVQRHYETCQRIISKQDQILSRSVNDLAKV